MRKMKDSGVEWIGQIPLEWDVCKLKYLIGIKSGDAIRNEDISSDGLYQVFGGGEIIGYTNKQNANEKNLLIGRVGARCGCVTKPLNQVYATDNALVVFTKENRNYFYDVLVSADLNKLNSSNAQPLLTATKIKNVFVPHPSLAEQQRIADFLDKKCGEIDSIRSDIQKQIDILNDYKKSVITEAVTKGLNPKAKLKDSGIEWIGKISEHWDCRPIKYGFKLISGSTPKSDNIDFWDGDVIWITPADYKTEDKYVCQGKRNISYQGFLSCSTNIVPKGSLIFSKRAPIGTVAINSVPLCTNQGCLSCAPKACSSSLYFYFVFIVYEEVFNLLGSGTTFKEISATTFSNVKLPYPSINEQKKIAAYLDEKCSEIDATIVDKQRQLETLDEYKKSLIFEYVTGKKEVLA